MSGSESDGAGANLEYDDDDDNLDFVPVLSGSEEAETDGILTRSRTRSDGDGGSEDIGTSSSSSEDFDDEVGDLDDDDGSDSGWLSADSDDSEFLDSGEEEEAFWSALEGDLSSAMENPQFLQRVWPGQPPSADGEERRDELYAYYTLLKQAHQMDDFGMGGATAGSRRLKGSASCCAMEASEGKAIKYRVGSAGSGDAQTTTDRHINSSYDHCQVADSLLCHNFDGGEDDEVIVMKKKTLQLFVVNRKTGVAAKRSEVFIGVNPYTLARSSCGECIAVGGDLQVMLFTCDRQTKQIEYSSILVFMKRSQFLSEFPMANSARFGKISGRERLLVTNQNGNIYVFEVPTKAAVDAACEEGRDASSLYVCTHLYNNEWSGARRLAGLRVPGRAATAPDDEAGPVQSGAQHQAEYVHSSSVASWEVALRHARGRSLNPHEVYVTLSSASRELITAVIGKFPIALNCAELSPDGKWLAVVGDSQMVFVCPMDKVLEGRVMRYRTSSSTSRGEVFMPHVIKLSLPSKRTKSAGGVRFPDGVSHRPFSQYCKWNSESSLLAATSDNGNYVAVWSSVNWSLLKVFDYKNQRPCLPLCFVAGLESTLLWAEDIADSVTVGNARAPKRKDRAFLRLPERMDKRKRRLMAQAFNNIGGMPRDHAPIEGQR